MVFITRDLPQEAIEAALTAFEKAVEEAPEPPSSADKPAAGGTAGSSSLPQRRSRDGRAAPRIDRGDKRELPISRLAATLLCYHIVPMARTHPHAEATYRVIAFPGGTFGVEVSIPDAYPTTVSTFATKADAEAWIAKHKSRVEAQSSATGWFRASRTRMNSRAGC